ncbi:MAG: diaminopimelate decarboxylase [Acidobacteriota bacterium]
MPMSESFETRLYPVVRDIVEHFGTPFHIYDEAGIRETGLALKKAFSGLESFREYFAVKALPNPHILEIMADLGFGFDCSSIPELILGRKAGGRGMDIMFTSNNTSTEEFAASSEEDGCILNLDDISLIPKVPQMPELICFRYNPGPQRSGNSIIGNPEESKYGLTETQLTEAYREAREMGARRFGLHTMVVSNEINYTCMVQTASMLLEQIERIGKALDIQFEFINIGGGFGIPYRPEDKPLNLKAMGTEIAELFSDFRRRAGYAPRLLTESGRFMTGPHGVLVARAINRKNIYRKYIGVDACMSALMRPGMYGAYHHITVPEKRESPNVDPVDVVGSLCENNDKFAIQRSLPEIEDGDILCIHDTGAHGHAMGFNYNGRLRTKELLLRPDGTVELIRRAETLADHFASLQFEPEILTLNKT